MEDEPHDLSLFEDTSPVRVEVDDVVKVGARLVEDLMTGCTPEHVLNVLADMVSVPRSYFQELVMEELERKSREG